MPWGAAGPSVVDVVVPVWATALFDDPPHAPNRSATHPSEHPTRAKRHGRRTSPLGCTDDGAAPVVGPGSSCMAGLVPMCVSFFNSHGSP